MTKQTLEQYIAKGYSIRKIANAEGTSYTNARYWVLKYGLETNASSIRKRAEFVCSCGENRRSEFYSSRPKKCKKCYQTTSIPACDWALIQNYYDAGHTIPECELKFNLSRRAFGTAKKQGLIKTRRAGHQRFVPDVQLFRENSSEARKMVKLRLIQSGEVENKCAICSQPPIWNGLSLVFVLDHKNGKNNDHRKENLQLVCPNCNSQLPTFSKRNFQHKTVGIA